MTEGLQDSKKTAILEALRQGNTRRAAAEAAGISSPTFYRWIAEDEALCSAVKEAEAEAEAFFLERVKVGACDSWQAAAWWLERRRREDFGRNEKLTIIQGIAQEVQKLSDAELAAIAYGDSGEPDQEAPRTDGVGQAGEAEGGEPAG